MVKKSCANFPSAIRIKVEIDLEHNVISETMIQKGSHRYSMEIYENKKNCVDMIIGELR